MTARFIPVLQRPQPVGAYEALLDRGRHLQNRLGYMCNRKLKRRYCKRPSSAFEDVMADTHAGDLCLDLGANVGAFTARMAATGADVISFEPDPHTFQTLQANVAHLPNVTLHQQAAGARAEQLTLRRMEGWSETATANAAKSEGASLVRAGAGMSDAHSVVVDVVDFTAFATALDRDIRILKIDIEGSEWDLMEALLDAPVLARIDTIFVETHERFDPQVNIARFYRLLDRAEALDRPYINLYWH